MKALKLRLQNVNKKEIVEGIAVLAIIVGLYYLGWGMSARASAPFYGPGLEVCISVGFYGFMLALAAAYSRTTVYNLFGWNVSNYFGKTPLWFYRAIAFVQAFCAGLTLHCIEILSPDKSKSAYYVSASIMFTVIFFTWAIKYLKPRITVALMPIALFIVGMFVSQSQVDNLPRAQADENFKSMVELFKILPERIILSDITINIIMVAVCVTVCYLYFIGRPLKVFRRWGGNIQGSALNAFIAMFLVVAPYAAEGTGIIDHYTDIRSVADSVIKFEPSTLTLLAWSWIIGNAISLIFYAIGLFFTPSKREEHYDLAATPYAPPTVYTPLKENTKKIMPPSEENKRELFARLFGQQDALTRLWDSTLYPVFSGQRTFGNALLLGPTGVGKTETAKVIADIFYEGRLLRFDMNHYSTEWESTRLIGSPPGFVGYSDDGGELIRGIRDQSPCVILLDEIEKAHPNILQVLLQLTGEGYVKTPLGAVFHASNSIILMTSNIWPERAEELWKVPQAQLKKELRGYITNRFVNIGPVPLFSPEFLGRLNAAIPYKPFAKEVVVDIFNAMLSKIATEKHIQIAPGSALALAEGIDAIEGYRGLRQYFDDTVNNVLNATAVKKGYILEITKKAGKIRLVVRNSRGKLVAEEYRNIRKGYVIDAHKLADFEKSPLRSIVGQDDNIQKIVEFLRIAVSGVLPDQDRPMGIFLLAGPTGVGKTETARALAQWLFDGRMIKKDMGEYKYPGDGRRLFGDQYKMGSLTKEVTELGSCVVLFDEIEKANPEVFDTFLALFDKGKVSDAATNLQVSFKNTIILMTTNLEPNWDAVADVANRDSLSNDNMRDLFAYHFRKELLGRIDRVLVYNELPKDAIVQIIKQRIDRIIKKKQEEGVIITVDPEVYEYIAGSVQSSKYGVRGADEVIVNTIGTALISAPEGVENIRLSVDGGGKIVITTCQAVS